MVNDELIQFVRGKLAQGATRTEIEEVLIAEGGWTKADVDMAFDLIGSAATESVPQSTSRSIPDDAEGGEAARATSANSRKLVLPVVIIATLLTLGVGVYFFAGDLIRSKFVKADTIDGFFLAFADGVKKIERFSYEIEVSAHQEPRSGAVEPLVLTAPEHSPEKIAAVERDVEKLSGLSTVVSGLDSFYRTNGNYPDSLDELDFYQPLDLTLYSYSGGGSEVSISTILETPEAAAYSLNSKRSNVAYIYRAGEYEEELRDNLKVDLDTLTATVNLSDGEYYYLGYPYSANSLLQESVVVQGFEYLGMLLRFLPERFKGDLTFSGALGVTERVPDFESALEVNVDWGDMIFKVGAEAITKDGVFYGRVNNFPSFPFLNIDAIRGQWIKVTEEDIEDNYLIEGFVDSDMFFPENEEELRKETEEALGILREAIAAHKPLTLKDAPRTEKLEDGRSAVRYSLGLDAAELVGFYEYLYEEYAQAFLEGDEAKVFQFQMQRELEYLQSPDFSNLVDYLNKNAEFVVWFDEGTGIPIQFLQKIVYVADPDTSNESFFGGGGSLNNQLVFSSKVRLFDINKSVNIQAPEEHLTPEDAGILMSGLYGESLEAARSRGADAETKSSANNSRAQAELYHDANNWSYLGVCASDQGISELIERAEETAKDGEVSCFDSGQAWAMEAKLSDDTFYCVDSTGKAGDQPLSSISSADMVCG